MIILSNKGSTSVFLYSYISKTWFREKISSLSQLLTKVCNFFLFYGGHFKFCMTVNFHVFICIRRYRDIGFGERIKSLSQILRNIMVTLVI